MLWLREAHHTDGSSLCEHLLVRGREVPNSSLSGGYRRTNPKSESRVSTMTSPLTMGAGAQTQNHKGPHRQSTGPKEVIRPGSPHLTLHAFIQYERGVGQAMGSVPRERETLVAPSPDRSSSPRGAAGPRLETGGSPPPVQAELGSEGLPGR